MTAGLFGTAARRFAAAALLAAVSTAACREFHPEQLQATASDQWVRSYDLAPGGEVQVVNANGNIIVERGAGEKVEVTAERVVKAATDQIAEGVLPRVTIREDIAGEKIVLQTESLTGLVLGVSISVNYRVAVPAGTRVRMRSSNGNVEFLELDANAVGSSENGNIVAKGMSRGVEARTVNGNVTVDLVSFEHDPVDLRTTNGRVDLTVPANINAALIANTTNGGVEMTGLAFEPTEGSGPAPERNSRRRIRGRLNAGGSPIELNSVNGGIRLHARE